MKAVIARENADWVNVDIVPTVKDRNRISERSLRTTEGRWRGWVTFSRTCRLEKGQTALETHADWPGPGKLIQADHARSKNGKRAAASTYQLQFYWDGGGYADLDTTIDDDIEGGYIALKKALARSVARLMNRRSCAQWESPEPEQLAEWLQKAGYQPVIDEKKNVRLTLKRNALTAQVRVTCTKGRLRFALVLGRWQKLSKAAETAMQRLVAEANRRVRLVRITWFRDEKGAARCEAVVDLTGMPWSEDLGDCVSDFWQTMIGKTCNGLEAVLHQLGLELTVLADPENEDLATQVCSPG